MLLTVYFTGNMLLKTGKPSMYQAVTCSPHSLERILTQNYMEEHKRTTQKIRTEKFVIAHVYQFLGFFLLKAIFKFPQGNIKN